MVAFHYPPEGSSSGVLRTLKFSRYLPEYGWKPHMLTVRETIYDTKDHDLLKQVPEVVKVARTVCFDTKKHLSIKGRYPQILALPDRFVSWLPFGVSKGLSILRNERPDAIFSTSPFATAHLIALMLKRISGLPWVADFRDPLLDFEAGTDRPSLRTRIEGYVEKRIVHDANAVVVTTDLMKERYLERFSDIDSDKISVIYNGFDEEDFDGLSAAPVRGDHKLHLIHVGSVDSEHRNPESLLIALSRLLRERPELREWVVLKFLGTSIYLNSPAFADLVERLDLREHIKLLPQVPREESLRHMMQADVLVLLQQSKAFKPLIPAKAFDYLMTGKPVLTIAPPGATASLMHKLDAGVVVPPDDIDGMKSALLGFYQAHEMGKNPLGVDRARLLAFSRRKLTEQLALLLNDLGSFGETGLKNIVRN